MSYHPDIVKKFTAVPYPSANYAAVHKFLRENFGDNDIFQDYSVRRWITVDNYNMTGTSMICFKDEGDAIWFQLKWSSR